MARGFQGVVMRGLGARDHEATVIGTRWVTPGLVRIQLVSPTIFEDSLAEPTSWLRFWFPDPEGTDAEHQRAYTITGADVCSGEFTIDVVLHEPAGPASTWARTVAPGATISVMSMGSKGFTVPVDDADRPAGYLLIGDAASTPAINGIIGAVPHDVPIEAYLEDRGAGHVPIPLSEHPQLTVHRVDRRDAGALAAAIEARDWSNWYAWACPEAGALKHVRNRLRKLGFAKRELHAQAYWSERRAMGTTRGEEIQESAPAGAEATAAPTELEPSANAAGILKSIMTRLRRCGWPASTK